MARRKILDDIEPWVEAMREEMNRDHEQLQRRIDNVAISKLCKKICMTLSERKTT